MDTRKLRQDNTYPILFRIGANRKYAYISSGLHLLKESFDPRSCLILNNQILNLELRKLETYYLERLLKIKELYPEVIEPIEIKQLLIQNKEIEITIYKYWQQIIKELVTQKRLGNAKTYEQSLSTISQEINLNIPFKAFSYKNLVELEGNLIKRGMTANGISVYLRSFRAVCNRAIKEDIVGYDWYPFRKFTIRKAKTTPRVVGIEDMRRYFSLDYPPTHPRFIYWHIGKLLFLLRGINLRDLLQLKPSDIKNGRIIYRRSKTGKIYSIELTEEMKASFAVFHSDHTLLGMMREDELLSSRRILIYKQRVKITNKHLKNIGHELGIEEPLSTYVFRYTYANIAKQLGYSKDLIAEALGHEYGNKITGIYLEQFDLHIVDNMNRSIINIIRSEK